MLQRIPATLILFVSGGILLLWGFLRQKRFGRTLAMILLFLAAFKLIYYDLPALNLAVRVVLLFLTGSLFMGLSLGYGTARKIFRKKTPQSRQHGSRSNSQPSGSPDGSAE
jgi:sugar phosphate permease